MLLTLAITKGFQDEIRAKVIGSASHIQIASITQTDPRETPRIRIKPEMVGEIAAIPGISHVQAYALRAGILETSEEIEGVLVKGVGTDMDWSFFKRHLVSGRVLRIVEDASNEILISKWHADRLNVSVDSTITVYLIKGESVRPRKYKVVGIYAAGLEQLDQEIVLIDIAHLQRFAQWGVQAELLVGDSCTDRGFELTGLGFGGDRVYSYEWPGTPLVGKGPHPICVTQDSTIMMVLTDASETLPDTAFLHIELIDSIGRCACAGNASISTANSGGSHRHYAGGFELTVNDYDQLAAMDDAVYEQLDIGLRTTNIQEKFPEIFSWLELLDTNVAVVIILMILVAIINMTSALLIIILERTRMIGILKALGAANKSIRRIFLIDAAYIMGIGIVSGVTLGLGLCYIQERFGVVTLPQESYYLSQVPISVDPWAVLVLAIGTLLICMAALILPTMLVTRIAPAKAIQVLE
jgi:lipoprotein-releasing system permease protein